MTFLGIFLVVGLFVLLALGVPIAFALGILTLGGLWLKDISLLTLPQTAIAGVNTDSLLAVLGFVFAGDLMTSGGLSRRLVRVASVLVGHLTGGLSMATVFAGTFFGAITGAAPATTAAIGSMMIDELEKRGYQRGYAAALATAIGPLGPLIPPSIPMVIWGVLSEQSITRLFLAGIVPGLLAACGFIAVGHIYARRRGIPLSKRAAAAEIIQALRDGFWALLAPVVILGGIYGGIFTPTEAAMVGTLYSLIVGVFIYKDISIREVPEVLVRALRTTAMIMFIISMAFGFAWLVASEQIPMMLTEQLLSLSQNPIVILLALNAILLFLGCVMDNISAMIILSTVLIQLGERIGLHPIQLGAMIVVNFSVGMVTPPVGYSLFVASSISGLRIEQITRHLWPFVLVLIAVVLLVAFVPALTLALPSALM